MPVNRRLTSSCDTQQMAFVPRLFEEEGPPGLSYRRDFITDAEQTALLDAITSVTFSKYEMRGVVARRRVAYFGQTYDRGEARPFPAFLFPLRERIAAWASVEQDAFAMALIIEYPAGAPIGWHRDTQQYDIVSGVSLLSECRMRFRPYRSPAAPPAARRTAPVTHEVTLEPRSAYLMTGESRNSFEHHIPPVGRLRYSVTFRTLR
jgi:alkylated DNA repair dioxygenase AlkB